MNQFKEDDEITLGDQTLKFGSQSMLGFQTILLFGLGRRLGIFDYLYEKGKYSIDKNEFPSVTFTIDELSKELNLDFIYLDGWLHMALTCGIFERDETCKKCLKTAPYVFSLLIDQKYRFYLGDFLGFFYYMAPNQDMLFNKFPTGHIGNYHEIPEEGRKIGHRMSAKFGKKIIKLFVQNYKDQNKTLEEGGAVLEVGCGFGFNLQNWARIYHKTRIIGIDNDSEAVTFANEVVIRNNWIDRIKILSIELNEYTKTHKEEFDVIVLNHVLHEMNPDKDYRVQVFKDLYSLLVEEGLLIVGEQMIPNIFSPKQASYDYILHKWFEIGFGSRFYDKETFRMFIELTPFKKVELIQAAPSSSLYLCAMQKGSENQ